MARVQVELHRVVRSRATPVARAAQVVSVVEVVLVVEVVSEAEVVSVVVCAAADSSRVAYPLVSEWLTVVASAR
ncbi:hypothetical protein [Nocardia sp. NPDC057440]|uniref:hypothetical protein n=1 Tax=Nocardia sp. NPDC057440 TaxID=3346134 RepID=UPI003672A732